VIATKLSLLYVNTLLTLLGCPTSTTLPTEFLVDPLLGLNAMTYDYSTTHRVLYVLIIRLYSD